MKSAYAILVIVAISYPQLAHQYDILSEQSCPALDCSNLSAGEYPNPTNCESFCYCVGSQGNMRSVRTECPSGLHFNAEIKVCDYPQNAKCTATIESTPSPEESTQEPSQPSTQEPSPSQAPSEPTQAPSEPSQAPSEPTPEPTTDAPEPTTPNPSPSTTGRPTRPTRSTTVRPTRSTTVRPTRSTTVRPTRSTKPPNDSSSSSSSESDESGESSLTNVRSEQKKVPQQVRQSLWSSRINTLE